jgi:hypothetical protein
MITSHFLSIFRLIIVLSIVILFVGCGGSGGSSFSISGIVSGAVSSDVIMTLSGTSTGTDTTDASGNYTFGGLAHGSYTISPSLSGYIFNPVSEAIKIKGSNIISVNFTATASTYPVYSTSGTVTLINGGALSGTMIMITGLSGNVSGTAATDSKGNYTINGLSNGPYMLTPTLTGYIFNPPQIKVDINGANSTSNNFTATASTTPTVPTDQTYSISGTVTWNSGGVLESLEGVTMMLAVTYNTTTATDSDGYYIFKGLTNGDYTITPSLNGYIFNAASVGIKINGADVDSINFVGVKE